MERSNIERIARVARWNGGSILVVAGLGALLSLIGGALVPTAFAAAIAYAGWRELGAGRRLAGGATGDGGASADPGAPAAARGTLVRSELAVLALIVGYSAWRLATADPAAELAALPTPDRELLASLTAGDLELLEQLFRLALKVTYGTLIVVTLVYQGGMAWWYSKSLGSTA